MSMHDFNIELKMSSCCSGSPVLNKRLNGSLDKSSLKAFIKKFFISNKFESWLYNYKHLNISTIVIKMFTVQQKLFFSLFSSSSR